VAPRGGTGATQLAEHVGGEVREEGLPQTPEESLRAEGACRASRDDLLLGRPWEVRRGGARPELREETRERENPAERLHRARSVLPLDVMTQDDALDAKLVLEMAQHRGAAFGMP